MGSFLFRLIRVLVVLGIALGLAFFLFHTREHPEKQKVVHSAPGVRVIRAKSGTHTMTVEAFGTVVPRKQVNLAAEIGGRIDYLHPEFRDGGTIRSSDLLIRIDQRSFILDKAAAKAGVDQARADLERLTREVENYGTDVELAQKNLELAQKERDRIRTLGQNQFASKTNVDRAEQEYLAARIQLQSAKSRLSLTPAMTAQLRAALALAENKLSKAALVLEKSEIRSGFDGYVLAKQAEIGEFVNPGQSLGILYEKGALDVDVRIPMEELRWIRELFDRGRLPRAEVSIANQNRSRQWPARVARIKANIDEKTRTLPITLEIDRADAGAAGGNDTDGTDPLLVLKPGTFVKCRIIGEVREHLFVLPRYLLHGEDTLYLARDDRLVMRKVKVLRKVEDQMFIDGGLSDDELVIASPLPGASEGMALSVKAYEAAQ